MIYEEDVYQKLKNWKEGEEEDERRHRCLVRWLIRKRMHNRDAAHRWLKGYADETGRYIKGWNDLHPNSRLEKDVSEQWSKGNRGNHGEWK